MHRLIQTIALTTAFLVLAASLWQGWGVATTLKRMLLAYMAFFFLGSLSALAVRAGALFDNDQKDKKGGRGRRRQT